MTALREDMRALVAAARTNAAATVRGGANRRDLIALLSRAHRAGAAASGLTQDELAALMGVARPQVTRFGTDESTDLPNAKHIARAPDAYVDALMRELAAVRTELGHAPRQWIPAPDLVHGEDDLARSNSVVLHCANAQRAAHVLQKPTPSASELKMVEREFVEAAEALLEAVERVRQRLRDARSGR